MTGLSVTPMQIYLQDKLGPDRPKLRWEMTPELAYGRHRGPARVRSRQAAVAVVLLHEEDGRWTIPLTRRPTTLRHHGGQICFPGGRIEPNETPQAASLREFHEELGVDLGELNACGQLPEQYVYASDNQVTPLVFVTKRPASAWRPDAVEVDEVIELPLSALLADPVIESTSQSRQIRLASLADEVSAADRSHTAEQSSPGNPDSIMHFRFRAPAYSYEKYRIWGATAVILNQLAQCLRSWPENADSERSDVKMAATSVRT